MDSIKKSGRKNKKIKKKEEKKNTLTQQAFYVFI